MLYPDDMLETLPALLYDEWIGLYTIEHEERQQAEELARLKAGMR